MFTLRNARLALLFVIFVLVVGSVGIWSFADTISRSPDTKVGELPTRTVSEILATLNQEELEAMLLSFRWRFGGAEPIGNYQLRSPDDGETWFVIKGFDGVEEFIGPAEEVYPGLVACLDTRHLVVQYARDFRPIPSETEAQTEAEQALITARSIACDNFKELNRPE